jgi:hypothetical protein
MRKLMFIAAVLLVAGCQKENPNARQVGFTDIGTPRILVDQPIRDQVFNNNDIVMINGNVIGDNLSMGSFEIRDNASGKVYFQKKVLLNNNDEFHYVSNTNGRFRLAAPMNLPMDREHNVTLVIQASDKQLHMSTVRVPFVIRQLPVPIDNTAERTSMMQGASVIQEINTVK